MNRFRSAACVLVACMFLAFSPAHAQTLPSVTIGVVKMSGSIPLYIAVDEGLFRKEGLDAKLVFFGSSVENLSALVAGDIQFASAAFSGAFFNLAAKGVVKAIASQLRDSPGFHLNALMATTAAYNKGFTKITDLPGKRIGTTTLGGTTDYFVGLMAKKYGFDLSKVEIVPLQTLDNQNAAFAGGQIDGGVIAAYAANQFVANGSGKIIAWTGDEVTWTVGAQDTTPKYIADHPDIVAKFVRGYQDGIHAYLTAVQHTPTGELIKGPGYDQVLAIVAKYLTMSPDKVPDIFTSFDPNGDMDVDGVRTMLTFFQQIGQVDKSAKIEPMLDLSFVRGTRK